MLTIQMDSRVSLADQIVTGIRCAIARRELVPGDTLPTVRQLAGDFQINQNTVARAYRMLEGFGLVNTTRGRGTIVIAERDSLRIPAAQRRHDLALRLRGVLADWRLAGLDQRRVVDLIQRELHDIWPEVAT